jgi:hypothetical protein
MGLYVKYVAPTLSQHRIEGDFRNTPSSFSKDWIHINSAVALARALYSDSVLALEMVGCFLDAHDNKLQPRKVQYPDVDFQSSGQPVQSASENATSWVEELGLMSSPYEIVFFK